MLANILTVLIGLVGGVSVGFQSPVAGAMGQRIGATASSFIVHLSGLLLTGVFLFFQGGEGIRNWRTLPWYMLASGGLGLIFFLTINHTMPRIGGTMMITLVIIGQLTVGMLIDHFGLFGVPVRTVTTSRLLAVLLLLAGGYLISK